MNENKKMNNDAILFVTTTLQKWGNSQGIRLPKYLLEAIDWRDNEQLEIKVENGKIVIEKKSQRKNIKELFENFDGDYNHTDVDWGEPAGEEIW